MSGDFPLGPVSKIPCFQGRGAKIHCLIRELDPKCHKV